MRRILLEYWRVLPFRDLQTNIEISDRSLIRAGVGAEEKMVG